MVRRWRWWILAAVSGLLVLAWLALPGLLVALVRRRLPLRLDDHTSVTQVATTLTGLSTASHARAMIAISPGRIKKIDQRIPTFLVRDGWCARALWHDLSEAPELPVELLTVVHAEADPPLVMLALPAEPLAALIARSAEPVEFAGSRLRWSYRLDPGTVLAHEGPPSVTANGLRRRFRVAASGQVTAWLDESDCVVRVSRLVGYVDLDFDRRADGWHMHGTATVEQVESTIERCASPLLRSIAGNLKGALELVLNTTVLSEQVRSDDVLPLWFPLDAALQVVVVAEPGDCAAAATLPLR